MFDVIDRYSNIFLKMDIEGGEFPWLHALSTDQLQHFQQIVIEIHGCNDDSWGASWNDKMDCLKKLSTTHFLVHVHGNNHSGTRSYMIKKEDGSSQEMIIPDVIELTYVRKSILDELPLNTTVFPIPGLDTPNCPHVADIGLNCLPFVH